MNMEITEQNELAVTGRRSINAAEFRFGGKLQPLLHGIREAAKECDLGPLPCSRRVRRFCKRGSRYESRGYDGAETSIPLILSSPDGT